MKDNYIIEKIPLQAPVEDFPKKFKPQPQMYLELLENKKKVLKEFAYKDYEPSVSGKSSRNGRGSGLSETRALSAIPSQRRLPSRAPSHQTPSERGSVSVNSTIVTRSSRHQFLKPSEVHLSRIDPLSERTRKQLLEGQVSTLFPLGSTKSRASTSAGSSVENPVVAEASSIKSQEQYNRKYTPRRKLPTLAEMERLQERRAGVNKPGREKIVNLERISNPEEDNKKRELLLKFDLLRENYPEIELPKFNIYDSFASMQRGYQDVLRRITVDNNVSSCKNYITYFFMGIEYACGKWLKLDMAGYTKQQTMQMNKYNNIIIEMGERGVSSTGESTWPPELRLLYSLSMSTALFIVGRLMMRKGVAKAPPAQNAKPTVSEPVKPAAAAQTGTAPNNNPVPEKRLKGPKK